MISIMFIQVLPSVCHVKIDLMSFSVGTREAGGGDGAGCDHDWFTVIGSADGRPAPLLCGQLDGYSSKNFFNQRIWSRVCRWFHWNAAMRRVIKAGEALLRTVHSYHQLYGEIAWTTWIGSVTRISITEIHAYIHNRTYIYSTLVKKTREPTRYGIHIHLCTFMDESWYCRNASAWLICTRKIVNISLKMHSIGNNSEPIFPSFASSVFI
jgi:hypothetical protein